MFKCTASLPWVKGISAGAQEESHGLAAALDGSLVLPFKSTVLFQRVRRPQEDLKVIHQSLGLISESKSKAPRTPDLKSRGCGSGGGQGRPLVLPWWPPLILSCTNPKICTACVRGRQAGGKPRLRGDRGECRGGGCCYSRVVFETQLAITCECLRVTSRVR